MVIQLENIARASVAEHTRLTKKFEKAEASYQNGLTAIRQGDPSLAQSYFAEAIRIAHARVSRGNPSVKEYGELLVDFYKDRAAEAPREIHPLND